MVTGIALMVTLSSVGAASAYLAACSRLPFMAGIDSYLPAAFGRIHPKWKTPYVAVLFYGLAGMLFAFLGQAATSVKGAYDVLVSMSVITYFIPYLFLFASMISVQKHPAGPEVIRVPGGKVVAIALAILGLITTSITICLSVLPSDDEPNKTLAAIKVVGMTFVVLAAGSVIYAVGKRRQARSLKAPAAMKNSATITQLDSAKFSSISGTLFSRTRSVYAVVRFSREYPGGWANNENARKSDRMIRRDDCPLRPSRS